MPFSTLPDDLIADQQSKELRTIELLDAHSTESLSTNDRLEDKVTRLEGLVEEKRIRIVQLEAIPRMAKAELNTPDKEVQRQLFQDQEQSSLPHSRNDSARNSAGSDQRPPSTPNHSRSMNDKGESDCKTLEETVRRLSFWITQITGAKDIGENPDNVSFPNGQTCRELTKLKKSVIPRIQGETHRGFPHWRRMVRP